MTGPGHSDQTREPGGHSLQPAPLPFHRPTLGEEEFAEVRAVLESGWLTTGSRVAAFEQQFGAAVESPALALSSGTAALHLALIVAGIGPGDVVISTPYTFCSTIHVIEQVGAEPLLVDVEPDTLNINPESIKAALEQGMGRIKAVMPVHFAGHACEMDAILELAREYNLAVIEDAAHAFGSAYRGRPIGRVEEDLSHAVAYSFYVTKNITTGEGGMLVGGAEFVDEARLWSTHGMSRDAWRRYDQAGSWRYDVVRPGFKYNMMDLQAAIGAVQLRRADGMLARRTAIAARYTDAFGRVAALQAPASRSHVTHAWHLYPLRLNLPRLNIDRDHFIAELQARGVGASVHFIPIHHHSYYRDRYSWNSASFPVTDAEFERVLSLPIYPGLADQDVDRVIAAVLEIVADNQR
jgi:dTDP-4-amino-4,6-dideoxygalactose transaminase